MTFRLSFQISTADGEPIVEPCIDARPLSLLVTAYEHDRGYTDPAGGYAGIVPCDVLSGLIDEYFLGNPAADRWNEFSGGAVHLLQCRSCHFVGCWDILAHIAVADATVRWSGFRQHNRPNRDYIGFGPFVFDLAQYREAVAQLAGQIR